MDASPTAPPLPPPKTPVKAVNLRDIGEVDPRLRKGVLYRCSQIYTPEVLKELKVRVCTKCSSMQQCICWPWNRLRYDAFVTSFHAFVPLRACKLDDKHIEAASLAGVHASRPGRCCDMRIVHLTHQLLCSAMVSG